MTNMIINSRIGKIGLFFILAAILSISASVHANEPRSTATDDQTVQNFVAEARAFGLAIDPAQVTVAHQDGGTVAHAALATTWNDEDLDRGVDVGFAYLAVNDGAAVPNGYYKLQLRGHGDQQQLAFLDKTNRAVTTMPVTPDSPDNGGGTSARIIYIDIWGDGWIHIRSYEDHWPGTLIVFICHFC